MAETGFDESGHRGLDKVLRFELGRSQLIRESVHFESLLSNIEPVLTVTLRLGICTRSFGNAERINGAGKQTSWNRTSL
jgi:hypothetical protein